MLSHHPDYQPKDKCSCGTEKALFDFIPDSIYGVSIQKSCCIHDHRYDIGGDENDKMQADKEFLMNMLNEIETNTKWYHPTFLARRRAMSYYEAVVRMGNSSFNWITN